MKVTVPVAAVLVLLETAADNVTLVPKLLVAGEAESVVVVAAVFTVIAAGAPDASEETKVGSPL
jgi:hypothetical protein